MSRRFIDIPSKLHPNCKCGIDEVDIDNNSESSEVVIIDADDDIDEKKEKVRKVLVEIIKKIQNIIKFINIFQKNTEKFQTPAEYFGISAWDVTFPIPIKAHKDNLYYKLKDLYDLELKQFIRNKYKVNDNVPVIIPKRNSKLYGAIIKSPEMQDFIKKYYKDIKAGKYKNSTVDIKFRETISVFATVGKVVVYKPYIDKSGNLVLIIVDYYDFSYLKKYGKDYESRLITFANNFALFLQNIHLIKNYVIIIPIEIKNYELWKYIK